MSIPKENEFQVSEAPPGSVLLLGDLAAFNVEGGFCATQAMCTRRRGPLGAIDGSTVTCSLHGAQFNVCTGAVLRAGSSFHSWLDGLSPNSQLMLRDRIKPGVRILFVGINPGRRSDAIGHHFAGYSNRFWKLLYESRLVPEPIRAEDDGRLAEWGYGITNLVPRMTPGIDTLRPEEYLAGAEVLRKKIRRFEPALVAVVGVTVFRSLLGLRSRPVRFGLQRVRLEGSRVFVLPNPSGRNANVSYAEMLAAFRALRKASARLGRARSFR